jgi:hypothetical protein
MSEPSENPGCGGILLSVFFWGIWSLGLSLAILPFYFPVGQSIVSSIGMTIVGGIVGGAFAILDEQIDLWKKGRRPAGSPGEGPPIQ